MYTQVGTIQFNMLNIVSEKNDTSFVITIGIVNTYYKGR